MFRNTVTHSSGYMNFQLMTFCSRQFLCALHRFSRIIYLILKLCEMYPCHLDLSCAPLRFPRVWNFLSKVLHSLSHARKVTHETPTDHRKQFNSVPYCNQLSAINVATFLWTTFKSPMCDNSHCTVLSYPHSHVSMSLRSRGPSVFIQCQSTLCCAHHNAPPLNTDSWETAFFKNNHYHSICYHIFSECIVWKLPIQSISYLQPLRKLSYRCRLGI